MWAGQSSCYEAGFLLQPDSDAIDQGTWIEGLHCPESGLNPTGCMEWSGQNVDIGACEMFFALVPGQPTDLMAQ